MNQNIAAQISSELGIGQAQVASVITLLDEGNTIPFLARYRKEQTGGLDEEQLRAIAARLQYLRNLAARKQEVLRLIEQQGKLTPAIQRDLEQAATLQAVEDIYRPFRPKRRTRASIARERGLEPLARWLLARPSGTPSDVTREAERYVTPEPEDGVSSAEAALAGACDIIADELADDPVVRQWVRHQTITTGRLVTRAVDSDARTPYEHYYDYTEAIQRVRPHSVLAINRGEREQALKVAIDVPTEPIIEFLQNRLIPAGEPASPADYYLAVAAQDAYKRLLAPAVERDVLAIGNGTASRETTLFVADLIPKASRPVAYVVVNEAGASVYSASPEARREFPDLDVSERSAVSIARRLQDPLAELVKIDPKSIGVGQYQHDVAQKDLAEALYQVVESVVNTVGVDLNTASPALLSYVAGLSPAVADNIVKQRESGGPFRSRQELLLVPRLGPKTFQQCAGFLRIPGGDNPLDNTPIHPESYEAARRLLQGLGFDTGDVVARGSRRHELERALRQLDVEAWAQRLDVGVPTLTDIVEALLKPGRDPRDQLPPSVFRTGVMTMADLEPGMVLEGTVRNVVDFGAFVVIGVERDGLVHISQLSDQYVRHPLDVVSPGDVVRVQVLSVDVDRERIALTMR